MEWFNITWVFGIVTIACAGFLLQMVLEYNGRRDQIMPALHQIREVMKRHEEEIEKVEAMITQARAELLAMAPDFDAVTKEIKEYDQKLAVDGKDDLRAG
jgi:uncharacterized coiled-coil DUF342 family protein